MADFIYDKTRQLFLEGSSTVAWLTANIKLVLVDATSYTPVQATDQYLTAIPSGMRVATSANFSSKTSTIGVANAAGVVLSAVSGAQCAMFVIYADTGTAGTSPLITHQDSYAGLPVTPNGGDISISFPTDANRIFKL
jgi:hypothetical protein